MDDHTNTGITLQNAAPLDETTTIDWDSVLRDFAEAHALSEQEKQQPDPPFPLFLYPEIGYNESNEKGRSSSPFSQ